MSMGTHQEDTLGFPKTVAVIGGGFYGAHIACSLSSLEGYQVTLYEQNKEIFEGISGKFGIRIHAGPHYPRSLSTRKACQHGYEEFVAQYPQLVNWHDHAVYALGKVDADGKPSKVSCKEFTKVCTEFRYKAMLNISDSDYNNEAIEVAFDLDEPSAVLGPRLRGFFQSLLQERKVDVCCDAYIFNIERCGDKIEIKGQNPYAFKRKFDYVINATSYKAFLPNHPLPFDIEVIYQPCLALFYHDKNPGDKPISFIVMDGFYPCLMPYDDRENKNEPIKKYIMTHGKWTIMGSYKNLEEANQALARVDDNFVLTNIKPSCESHMSYFWLNFLKRFEYTGWESAVLAKIKTGSEFRSALVFKDPDGVIDVFPGKITSIFDAQREVLSLMQDSDNTIDYNGYSYPKHGMLTQRAHKWKQDKEDERSTSRLQTFSSALAIGGNIENQPLLSASNTASTFFKASSTEPSSSGEEAKHPPLL